MRSPTVGCCPSPGTASAGWTCRPGGLSSRSWPCSPTRSWPSGASHRRTPAGAASVPTGRDVVADGSPTRWSPGSANRPSTFEERPVGLIAPPATRRATAASQRARRAAATVGANDLPPPGAAGCHRAPPAVTGHRWLSPAAGCHRAPLAVTGRRRPPSGAASCPVAPRPSLCQARPAGAGRAGRADEGGRHAAPSLSPPPCRPVGRQRSERSYAPFDTVEGDRPPLTAAGSRRPPSGNRSRLAPAGHHRAPGTSAAG